MKKLLVVDIGGTNVKLMTSPERKERFESGKGMGPREFVEALKRHTDGWNYDAVSVGYPAVVRGGQITKEPKHLGKGWVGFNLGKAIGKPTRVINDAAMQALGSYHGGRMLFLGLGTGLGSTLIWDDYVLPLELGDLPFGDNETIEDYVGQRGLNRLGRPAWKKCVLRAIGQLKIAFVADYIMLGGGNARLFKSVPEGVELGANRNAFLGGRRLWQEKRGGEPRWAVI